MNWKSKFELALLKYVRQFHPEATGDSRQLYLLSKSLTPKQRRGMWEQIGRSIQASGEQIHNHFHNTWSKQFYDSITPYLNQLNRYIEQQFSRGATAAQICQQFSGMYPAKNFSPRYLQQVVNIKIKRMGNKTAQKQEPSSFVQSVDSSPQEDEPEPAPANDVSLMTYNIDFDFYNFEEVI